MTLIKKTLKKKKTISDRGEGRKGKIIDRPAAALDPVEPLAFKAVRKAAQRERGKSTPKEKGFRALSNSGSTWQGRQPEKTPS